MVRIFFALVNTAGALALAYDAVVTAYRTNQVELAVAILLAVNAGLLFAGQGMQRTAARAFRLVGLWFDAKEAELRRRAGHSEPESGPA